MIRILLVCRSGNQVAHSYPQLDELALLLPNTTSAEIEVTGGHVQVASFVRGADNALACEGVMNLAPDERVGLEFRSPSPVGFIFTAFTPTVDTPVTFQDADVLDAIGLPDNEDCDGVDPLMPVDWED